MTAIAKVGTEFLANTQSARRQQKPSIPSLANGGFLVMWSDFSGMLGGNSEITFMEQLCSANTASSIERIAT